LTNTSAASITLSYAIQPPDFSIVPQSCGATLGPGANCTLGVTFTPSISESVAGSLSVSHSGMGPAVTVALQGATNDQGLLTVSPSPIAFQDQEVSTTGAALDLDVANSRNVALTVTAISIDDPEFKILPGSCFDTLPFVLKAFFGCAVNVTFTPSSPGPRTGSLSVTVAGQSAPYVFPVSGAGVSSALEVNPAAVQFPAEPVDITGGSQSVTLTNVSGAALGLSVGVSGPFSQTNNCGSSLANGASCAIQVSFMPLVVGNDSGSLTIQDAAEVSPHVVALSGSGLGAALSVSSSNVIFLDQPVGTTSLALTVTVTNHAASPEAIANLAASGDFAQTNNCAPLLASGGSCTINLTFTPSALGLRTGAITFSYGSPGAPQTITASGNGALPPSIGISPATVLFNPVLLSGPGAGGSQEVSISNSGAGPLIFDNMVVSGPAFALTGPRCGLGLPANDPNGCLLDVLFSPPGLGAFSGSLQIFDTASGSPQTIPLSGQGTDLTLSNVTASNAGPLPLVFNATVATIPAETSTVALSCSVSPATVYQCRFSQNSLVLNQTAGFTVTVSALSNAGVAPPKTEPGPATLGWLLEALLATWIFWNGAAWLRRKREEKSRVRLASVALALGLLLAVGLASCSNGNKTAAPAGAGSFPSGTVTITGTSSNAANPPQTLQLQFVPQ
jgi:hypothetical protein